MNLPNFWNGTSLNFDSFRGTNHTVSCLVKICPFLGQNQHFGLYLSNGLLNFADFWYRNLSYDLLLENRCLQSRKYLAPPNLGHFWSKFAPFWPKIDILAYIFKTACWVLLSFCIPILWSSLKKIRFTVREKSSPAHFGHFLVQICPF